MGPNIDTAVGFYSLSERQESLIWTSPINSLNWPRSVVLVFADLFLIISWHEKEGVREMLHIALPQQPFQKLLASLLGACIGDFRPHRILPASQTSLAPGGAALHALLSPRMVSPLALM